MLRPSQLVFCLFLPKMEYFTIVNNSETCVEETICVVRVQKPGWAGGSQGKSQNQDFIDEVHGL